MKHNYFLLTAFLLFCSVTLWGQQRYNADVENTGSACAVTLPTSFNTANANLPDPFLKLNGQRMTTKEEWTCRRQEILRLLERTVYGTKPAKPANVSGSVSRTNISVNVGGATFSAAVTMPSGGKAPYPLVIQYGGGVSNSIFTNKGCAVITLPLTAIAGGTRQAKSGAFYTANPNNRGTGHCAAWAWGVSRIIDVLEQDPNKLFDPTAVGVTGCSRNGKGAFAAGDRFGLHCQRADPGLCNRFSDFPALPGDRYHGIQYPDEHGDGDAAAGHDFASLQAVAVHSARRLEPDHGHAGPVVYARGGLNG